jgi:8-oxo-dGTP pyrophosphatase MutT (NUDIX family)
VPFDAVHATNRRIERRKTARVLLIDPHERVLLFHDSDPGLPGSPRFWITPGGGIDAGETVEQAALREVAEETGLILEPSELLGPIAHRTVVHGYSDKIVEQDETYFVVRVDAFEVDVAGHTIDEQFTFVGHRWWASDELRATDARVWPTALADLIDAATEPGRWPIPVDDAEESTVPADAGSADRATDVRRLPQRSPKPSPAPGTTP